MAADDRTGALETAGAIADATGASVPVVPWGGAPALAASADVLVVDAGTRHLGAVEAAGRCELVEALAARRHAHKVDSTLRGGWATELAVRSRHRRVLLVPALPSLGRTCVDGVVLVEGRPVHEGPSAHDVGRLVSSSRPAAHLRAAGLVDVRALRDVDECAAWLDDPGGERVAVCDAATEHDLLAVADRWAGASTVLLAGTSAVIAAGARHVGLGAPGRRTTTPDLRPPVLVVRGSAHDAAVEQTDRLVAAGATACRPGEPIGDRLGRAGVIVLAPPPPAVALDRVDAEAAARTVAQLAEAARPLLDGGSIGTLVVLGGDTAAAVLGDRVVTVHGTVAPGTPWGTTRGSDARVVARSGGFGAPDALVDLLSATLSR